MKDSYSNKVHAQAPKTSGMKNGMNGGDPSKSQKKREGAAMEPSRVQIKNYRDKCGERKKK